MGNTNTISKQIDIIEMEFLTEDLWEIILSRLPLKNVITSKLVCKQWKSLVESRSFRDLFVSHHKTPYPSSWSFICRGCETETMAHYGHDNWNLKRSLGSYVTSFLTEKFENRQGRVVAYTDVGLVLILVTPSQSFYVANPVSRQCVEILPNSSLKNERFWILGLVTLVENGVVVGFKVVLLKTNFSFFIYSSETGLWSVENVDFPFSFINQELNNPINLNGNLHWLAHNLEFKDFVVSVDFYGTGPDRCRTTPFPDLDKGTKYKRACTTSQGFLMYVNIVSERKVDGNVEDKLCVWRLKCGEWQLVSEISPTFMKAGVDYIPLGINPFDDKIVYFWSGDRNHQSIVSINLENGDFVHHDKLERSGEGRVLSSVDGSTDMEYILESHFTSFVLSPWLHRFPNIVRRV